VKLTRHNINAVYEKFAFWEHKINAVLQKIALRVHEINADRGIRYAKGLNSATAPLLAPSTARTSSADFHPFKIV